jgi:hypothetical protein
MDSSQRNGPFLYESLHYPQYIKINADFFKTE